MIPETARLPFNLLVALGATGFGIYLVVMPERALQKSGRPTTKVAVIKTRAIGIMAIVIGVFGFLDTVLR